MVKNLNSLEQVYDAVICGRGLIGTSLAVALQRGGMKVLLLDFAVKAGGGRTGDIGPAPIPEPDRRTTAVAAASREWLRANGLWRQAGRAGGDIAAIRVSDRHSRLFLDFDPAEFGASDSATPLPDSLGTIALNRQLMDDFTQAVAESSPSIAEATVSKILEIDLGVEASALARLWLQPVGAEEGSAYQVATPLIIAADGKNSPLRERMGIESWRWDYGQTALVFSIEHEHSHQNIAHERFLAGGPLAVLPLEDSHQSSVVWTERSAVAAEIAKLSPAAIAEDFWVRFGPSLGRIALLDTVKTWPLEFVLARRLVVRRLVLVGDAAHLLHPIAGQGANLGWRDCAELARQLVSAKAHGLDHGSSQLLESYESQRWLDCVSLSLVTNGLNRLFQSQSPGLAALRDVGLGLVNRIPGLKKPMMLQAMGMGPQQ